MLPVLAYIQSDDQLAKFDLLGENVFFLPDEAEIVRGAAGSFGGSGNYRNRRETVKDLKHLYYFENLLEEVNNDLVREGLQRGDIAIGSVCSLIPEVLLNLPGTFAVRLRAPRTGSIEMGTYYMTSLLCEGCRAYLERALEGGYEFLDCILAPDACAQMNRCVENIEKLQLCNKEKILLYPMPTFP